MDYDLIFVLGCVITAFSVPAMVSAYSDGRSPRYPAMIILIGIVMIGYVINERPSNYTIETIPDVFVSVIGRYIG
tara:strand:+ start:1435 stop:1659 length:225 start_codon:yes stop_codon:yes gene_type:complete